MNQIFKDNNVGGVIGSKQAKNGDSRLKRLKAENKNLREQIKRLKELVSSDKVLK